MMKLSLILSTGLVASTFTAGAQNQRPNQTGPVKGAPALMAALDKNGDGKLQQEEVDMAVVVLRRMDANKDGTISADEMSAPSRRPGMTDRPNARPGQSGNARRLPSFKDFDKDGDGKISKEEAPDRMKERFDQMDLNKDGFIDETEQKKIIERLRERLQDGQQRRRGEGQRPGGQRRNNDGDSSGGVKPKRPAPIE